MSGRLNSGELAVAEAFARGLDIAATARELHISEHTVNDRVSRACKRLGIAGVCRQPALVHQAYLSGHLPLLPCRRPPLSERLLQVLTCLAHGKGRRATAAELGISQHTAKEYLRRLYEALGTDSPSRAVALGWKTGLLRAEPAAQEGSGR